MERLPVELLYEIHSLCLSENLPCTSSYLRAVFGEATISHRVSYLVASYEEFKEKKDKSGRKAVASTSARGPIAHALLFPLCTEPVLEALFSYYASHPPLDYLEKKTPLPRRLFSSENMSSKSNGSPFRSSDAPLPFLRRLFALFGAHGLSSAGLDVNANGGYALTRAVFVGHLPLVLFLLGAGAQPARNDALAVRVAIRKRNLQLVRLLVEGGSSEAYCVDERSGSLLVKPGSTGKKRRRVGDRVDVNATMLREAVEVDAKDVVRYLLDKGARPDMQVMAQMQRSGLF